MKIINFNTVEELNTAGADFIISRLKGKESNLLCAATGNSATGIYQILVNKKDEINTSALKLIQLDEWADLHKDNPGSCEYYLQHHLLQPLNIPIGSYISFDSQSAEPAAECKRIQEKLHAEGPIDLCVLGIGLNGHIAFNDPADELQSGVHLAKLSEASMAHPMVKDLDNKPQYGYTLGIADILQSKTILLVIHGEHKKEIFERLLKSKISTQLPASFLWLHNMLTAIIAKIN